MKESILKWGIRTSIAGLGLALLDALFLEKYFFQVKKFDIGKDNGQKKLRMLLLTDLHFKLAFWPFHSKLVRKINTINPDIILITGDTFDHLGTSRPVKKFFKLLNPHLKKVAILGNHDHSSITSLDKIKKVYKQYNVDLLINETRTYTIKDEILTVTGLDDFIESCSNFAEAVKDVGKEDNHLLLIHSPLQQETVQKEIIRMNASRSIDEQLNIQYIFAGHNHGGQIRFFNYVPVLPLKSGNYVNGWYNSKKPYLYVSKGFGTSTIPLRFMATSEITLLNYYV